MAGKRKRQEDGDNIPQRNLRKRIIIYSSDEESNNSNSSDNEPVAGPSHDTSHPVLEDSSPHEVPSGSGTITPAPDNSELVLDDDLLSLLGEAPEPETVLGKPIQKDIATRWLDILKKGLTKEVKEKLEKDYLIPKNCELLVPPLLNAEAKAALTDIFVKRDNALQYRQKQTSNAVAALAQAIDTLITSKCDQELKQKILKPVNDACRILCDMHRNETVRRRRFVITSVTTSMKDTLVNSGTDKYLFGDNMSEKLRAAKTVQKSGEALKGQQKSTFHKSNFYYNRNGPNKNRPNWKPLHQNYQKTAGKQQADAGRSTPPARYQSRGPNARPATDRARDRSPPPTRRPPPRRR